MVGRLILGLIWLTCVHSDTLNDMPMDESAIPADKMSMKMTAEEPSSSTLGELMSVKSKRYLSHHHQSPCPPFYPHLDMPMPIHAMRPYGPPAYPKNVGHMAMHHGHQSLQFIHQPTYSSYVPKQTVQYVKQQIQAPIYHHPSPPVHHVQPIHAIVKQPPQPIYHQHYQQPMIQHKPSWEKQPIFAYAPAYHKPMPMFWPAQPIKKIEHPVPQVSYHQPAIIYKPEVPKCAPCPPAHPSPAIHHVQAPTISYVKTIPQPIHPVEPPKVYLPAPVHHAVFKPCDK